MAREVVELSESETTPVRPKRKSQRASSSPPREKAAKKNGRVEEEQEGEEEEADPDEEYEIEYIIQAKKGVIKSGKMAYLIKWKGYDEKDNSWVDEDDLQADELKNDFWREQEAKKQRTKALNTTRKSDASTRRASGTGLKSESSEPKVSANSSKRGRKSGATAAKDASDYEMETETPDVVEQPPKKKTKTTKKSGQPALPPSRTVSPNELINLDDDNTRSNYDSSVMDKYKKIKDWSNIVDKVETVEQMENNDLLVYFVTIHGERGVQNSLVMREHCPGKLLEFYEDHLRWKREDEDNDK